MSEVAVIAPVLNRPERVAPLAASLAASQQQIPLRLILVCSPGDTDELRAAEKAGVDHFVVAWEPAEADWAKKINYAFRILHDRGDVDWMLTGADDLHFHPGWADAAVQLGERVRRCVIGTNDHGNPAVRRGQHATHSLIHRDYIDCGTIDQDGVIACELYDHNFVDNELVETARARHQFAFAPSAIVEHLHPIWKKGEWDAVYEKGQRDFDADRLLFNSRRQLWSRR